MPVRALQISLVSLLVGCTSGLEPGLQEDLQQALEQGRRNIGAPGATMAVIEPGRGAWAGHSGTADAAGNTPLAVDDRFRIASITKLYVAALVLQLDEEGTLSLDDPLSSWLPDAPHADRVRIRHLVAHTSGFPDYTSNPAFFLDTARPWDPWELIGLIEDEPLGFEPDTDFGYANTNYVLLGLVVEAATGRGWGEEIQDRFLDPLALDQTYVPSSEPEQVPVVQGHNNGADASGAAHPSTAWAAGEMVANVMDVALWSQALLEGDVLEPETRDDFVTPVELKDDEVSPLGLGIEVNARPPRVLLGHSGSILGFQSRVHHDQVSGITVAVLVNDFLTDADEIDARAWEVLDHWRPAH